MTPYSAILRSRETETIQDNYRQTVVTVSSFPHRRDLFEESFWQNGTYYISKNYITYECGGYSTIHILHDKWPDYAPIRRVAQNLTSLDNVGFTPTQVARRIDKWLRIWQKPLHNPRELLPDYGFYYAIPCHKSMAYMHDMSGAYWQIASKLPSPLLCINRDNTKIHFERLRHDQEKRWRGMLSAFESFKAARLAIIGNWVAGYSGQASGQFSAQYAIRHGKRVSVGRVPTRLNAFGLLVVRCVYELCQEQFTQSHGIYAYVDCVITEQKSPEYWDNIGIKSTIKAQGETQIDNIQARKVGGITTEIYNKHYELLSRVTGKKPIKTDFQRAHYGPMLDRNMYYHHVLCS